MRVKRDGTIVEVTDRDFLLDGETLEVDLQFMDSKRTTMFTDGAGRPAGQRPGFIFRDDGADKIADAISETVYAEYRADISERWKSDRWSAPHRSAPLAPSFATADAGSVDAAYETYAHDIQNRWKHRR